VAKALRKLLYVDDLSSELGSAHRRQGPSRRLGSSFNLN
jgi:hypothetical protein